MSWTFAGDFVSWKEVRVDCITYFSLFQTHSVTTQPAGEGAGRPHDWHPKIFQHQNHREGKLAHFHAAFVLIFHDVRIYQSGKKKALNFALRMFIGRLNEAEGRERIFFFRLSSQQNIESLGEQVKSSFFSFVEWKVKLNWKIISENCKTVRHVVAKQFEKSIKRRIELWEAQIPFQKDCNIFFLFYQFVHNSNPSRV